MLAHPLSPSCYILPKINQSPGPGYICKWFQRMKLGSLCQWVCQACVTARSVQPASSAPTTSTSVLLPVVCKESPGSNRGIKTNCKYRMSYETSGAGWRIWGQIRGNVINYFRLLFSKICGESVGFNQESVSLNFTIVTVGLGRYIVLNKTNCCSSTHKRQQQETEYHTQYCLKHAGYVNRLSRFGLSGLLLICKWICNWANDDAMKLIFFNEIILISSV